MNPEDIVFDLIGVGAPIMDIVAAVPDSFLYNVRGQKGGMVMIDADEMAQLVARLPEPPEMTPGGSAANTIFNAARLGLRTSFIGKLGGDELARLYRARFGSAGVNTERFKHSDLPNARSLILTTPDAQRTMRTYLGAHLTLGPGEIKPKDFAGCRHVHLEGYLVFNRALADAVVNAARAAGCKLSLDLASFEVVRANRDWILEQLTAGIDVVFANEDEINALFPDGTTVEFAALARRLAHYGGTAAVKLGKNGAVIACGREVHVIAPHVVEAIDTNGAGDAWAAGFLMGYLRGWPLPACGALASFVGAETVRHMGPIIPDSHWKAVKTQAMTLTPK